MFLVQQRERIYGFDTDSDEVVWLDPNADHSEVTEPELLAKLEADFQATWEEPFDYRRTAYQDRWVYVQACFTEVAAQAYIDANRHRLTDPRIYVDSAYRNHEWNAVAEILARDPGRLLDAIRRFTFDAPNDEPNGPLEQALVDMSRLMNKLHHVRTGNAEVDATIAELADCAGRWCFHSAEDATRLRESAEELFPGEDFKGTPSETLHRAVELGEPLFSFHSREHWENKGRELYATCGFTNHDIITLDAIGRVVVSGREFTRAKDEGTYPITVYPIDPNQEINGDLKIAGAKRERELCDLEANLAARIVESDLEESRE